MALSIFWTTEACWTNLQHPKCDISHPPTWRGGYSAAWASRMWELGHQESCFWAHAEPLLKHILVLQSVTHWWLCTLISWMYCVSNYFFSRHWEWLWHGSQSSGSCWRTWKRHFWGRAQGRCQDCVLVSKIICCRVNLYIIFYLYYLLYFNFLLSF